MTALAGVLLASMLGTYIIIAVVVIVLAAAAGSVSLARSRRRGRGTAGPTSAPPTRPPTKPTTKRAPTTAPPPVAAEAPVETSVAEAEPAIEAPPSYRSRLGGVRGLFGGAVAALRAGRIDAATWDSLEEALIRADVGVATADALLADLRAKVETNEVRGGDDLLAALGQSIRELLRRPFCAARRGRHLPCCRRRPAGDVG